jgi:cytochrome c-type biogenesis protein CcmH
VNRLRILTRRTCFSDHVGHARRSSPRQLPGQIAVKVVVLLLIAASCTSVRAVTPDEMLADPKLEARARAISTELRCVVCQNQSIDDSNAPLAHDLRVLLRERLAAGDSDQQSVAYLVARYGNFVLLKPPLQWNTLMLWAGPALFLLLSVFAFARYFRRPSTDQSAESSAFSAMEQERLDVLLNRRGSE